MLCDFNQGVTGSSMIFSAHKGNGVDKVDKEEVQLHAFGTLGKLALVK